MKVKIICDSTAGLTEDFVVENNIEIIPLNVVIDGVSYKDGVDIELEELMDKFYAGSKVSTSQPSPAEFINVFNKAKEEGYTDIMCFTISSTLSGTYNSATLSKKEIEDINIHIVDTLSASIGAEVLVHEGVEYLKTHSIEETLAYIERLKSNAVILLNMEDLTALKLSGRITRIKAALGNLIRVKPILEYVGGKLSVITKFRTEGGVFQYILSRLGNDIKKAFSKVSIYLSHVKNNDKVIRLKTLIEEEFKNVNVHLSLQITPVIAVNIGYGGFGVTWCYE